MKSPIIVARLGPLTRECKRIADALELLLRLQYNYHMTKPTTDTSGPDPGVEYADDTASAIRELQRLYYRQGDREPPEDEGVEG